MYFLQISTNINIIFKDLKHQLNRINQSLEISILQIINIRISEININYHKIERKNSKNHLLLKMII